MNKKVKSIIIIFLIILLLLVILKSAWVCDDAYITFRTVDNFVNVYGLRWNVIERVQSYTSPLWMFLISFFYFFTKEIYFTTIFVSIFITLMSVLLLARQYDFIWKILLIIFLMSSKTFIDFSTSGLENPLIYLLLVIFLIMYIKSKYTSKNLLKLTLISSLLALTRVDLLVFIILPLFYFTYKTYSKKEIIDIIKSLSFGFLPFIIWELFSLFYYGFPLANTYYAKLNLVTPKIELFKQGLYYLIESTMFDPFLVIIILGVILPYFIKDKKFMFISNGILLYTFFVLKAGGDFMNGRFLLAQFIASTFILFYFLNNLKIKKGWKISIISILIILILILSFLFSSTSPIFSKLLYKPVPFSDHGIADERSFYYYGTGLIFHDDRSDEITFGWVNEGKELRNKKGKLTVIHTNVGFLGYYAGPNVTIIDKLALTDPLLARLDGPTSRPGHSMRQLPNGYFKSVFQNDILIEDENMATYYEKIKIITRGNLFDFNRLKEIIKMNLGLYEHLINKK